MDPELDLQFKQAIELLPYNTCYPWSWKFRALMDPLRVHVNMMQRAARDDSLLHLAVKAGKFDAVKTLLHSPLVDPNEKNSLGETPFWVACQIGAAKICRLMLEDERISTNCCDNYSITAVDAALVGTSSETVQVLLRSPRIVINWSTPCKNPLALSLGMQSHHDPHCHILKTLIATGKWDRELRSPIYPLYQPARFFYQGLEWGAWKNEGETLLGVAARISNGEAESLIRDYLEDPPGTVKRCRQETQYSSLQGEVFALCVFFCDSYLRFRVSDGCSQELKMAQRFFGICSKLPMELQMVIAARSQGSAENFISVSDFEISLAALSSSLLI